MNVFIRILIGAIFTCWLLFTLISCDKKRRETAISENNKLPKKSKCLIFFVLLAATCSACAAATERAFCKGCGYCKAERANASSG